MPTATIETDKGTIEIDIYDKGAPRAAANFVELANKGFYDGVIFHRIVPGFVIQGGDGQYGQIDKLDRSRVGTGGPGYKFEDEPFSGDYVRGAVAMANAGPNTNGSQFFICLEDLSGRLPKQYTLFGQVTKGMDVVDAIAALKRDGRDLPHEPVAMRSVKISA
jgi:cyclophilin family peptidyl-prolyl cis-trans isomerase